MNPVPALFLFGTIFVVVMSLMGCTPAPCAAGCLSATVEHERMIP